MIADTDDKEIACMLQKLSDSSKNDILQIDSKLLNLNAGTCSPSLSYLVNISLQFGHCPLEWKLARVTPAYKGKGHASEKTNYRPLSVISHVAKIMEHIIHKQLIRYLAEHKFISPDQFAYLKGHSTEHCLHRLINDILENINENEKTALCFLDIRKCFDTINHNILLEKLKCYGIRNNELQWFTSYL